MNLVRWERFNMNRWTVVLGITVAAMASTAGADEIALDFNGYHFAQSESFTAVTNHGTVIAGANSWTVTSGGEDFGFAPGQQIMTFATEIVQSFVSGGFGPFETSELNEASPGGEGMGEHRAGLMQSLYNQYGSESLTSARAAAAFQLAIWEIAYETDTDGEGELVLDAGTGEGFIVTDGGVMLDSLMGSPSALNLANEWLSALTSVQLTSLIGLSDNSAADQVITVVPLPTPVYMAAIGLLVLPFVRRRWLGTYAG